MLGLTSILNCRVPSDQPSDAWSVHCSRTLVDHELMELAAARPVLTYTVNELAEAQELFALGVAGVFSDFPGRLRRQIEAA